MTCCFQTKRQQMGTEPILSLSDDDSFQRFPHQNGAPGTEGHRYTGLIAMLFTVAKT